MDTEVEAHLDRRGAHLRAMLKHAARELDAEISGEPVFGWRMRSIGSRVRTGYDERWLRVVAEYEEWAYGEPWTGNTASTQIKGVRKPTVTKTLEWRESARLVRAEIMTVVPGLLCSRTHELRGDPRLPAQWWRSLRPTLDKLAANPTRRVNCSRILVDRYIRVFFGPDVDTTTTEWATAHGDLHWSNLVAPDLGILDWESWGIAPAGFDAATLYCFSLLHPPTARRIHTLFADVLDTRTGAVSQLYAITRLLGRVGAGDFPDLLEPLHRHARATIVKHFPEARW